MPSPQPGSTADLGARALGMLIDWGIGVGGIVAVLIVAAILGVVSDALRTLVVVLGYLALLAYFWVYLPYMEGTTGQTIGKRMQNIRTVSAETGQPVGFGLAFVRYLLNGIVCSLGWLLPFVDSAKQTLGDKVSKGITIPA